MRITAIASRKGGAGKTSTAHALGAYLAAQGLRVLFIDLDSQGNLSDTLRASADHPGAWEMLTGSADVSACLQHAPGGDVIAAAPVLATADMIITQTGREYRLRDALRKIGGQYDHIIIDTPGQLGVLTVNALTASDGAVIPLQAQLYSLQGLGQLADTVRDVRTYTNQALCLDGVLLCVYDLRGALARDMRAAAQEMAAQMGTQVFDTVIRKCSAVGEAQAERLDIYRYSRRSNAAKDYTAFCTEWLQKVRS